MQVFVLLVHLKQPVLHATHSSGPLATTTGAVPVGHVLTQVLSAVR